MSQTIHRKNGRSRVVSHGTQTPKRPGPVPIGHPQHPATPKPQETPAADGKTKDKE